MDVEEGKIGFVKYTGRLVDDGYMDARKSAQALIGFDEAIRFFTTKQAPDLLLDDFELPVRIKRGSWEIVVGAIVGAYGIKAAQKMAEKDFNDVGLVDILKKSISAMQWMIRIGKHLGDLGIKEFENVTFKNSNELVGIPNSEGEILYVPRKFLDHYTSARPTLLKNLSELVDDERSLSLGVYENGILVEEELTRRHRNIFTLEEDVDDTQVLPELEHGTCSVRAETLL